MNALHGAAEADERLKQTALRDASVICDVFECDGGPLDISPARCLSRWSARADWLGFSPIFAYEFEFYLFRGTSRELARRHWRDLEPLTEGHHTGSVYRDAGSEFLIGEVRRLLAGTGSSSRPATASTVRASSRSTSITRMR